MAVDGNPVTPYKYRSLKSIQKQKILEARREELEIEHFSLSEHIDVLANQPPHKDEVEQQRREESIAQTRDRIAVLESMANEYNKKLLDIREESDSEEEAA